MALVTITVRTAERVGGSEDKFYRTYELPTCSLFQWGSQRNGRSGGQFKISPSRYDAAEQIHKKTRDGYMRIGNNVQFQVDEARLAQQVATGSKGLGPFLDSLLAASGSGSQPAPRPAPTPDPVAPQPKPAVTVDRIAEVNKRALTAIAQAATDPTAAITEYSVLTGELEDLDAALRKIKSYMETLEILVSEAL